LEKENLIATKDLSKNTSWLESEKTLLLWKILDLFHPAILPARGFPMTDLANCLKMNLEGFPS
jgi:hypothetical protein